VSAVTKQKKPLRVAEASAAYLVELQQARHSGEGRNPAALQLGWRWARMGDVAEIIGGGTPNTNRTDYFGGDIPWITPADLSGYTEKFISKGARSITQAGLDNSGARLMPAGAVLFSSRAPIGYVAIAANPVSTNQGFKSFVLRDGLTPDYVYYYLQHAKKLVVELASGTTFLEISGKKAAQIPIPVPPLDVQRRIVAEIEKQFTRLEAGIAALRRVQANLKRYRAAVLKAACEGHFVPTEAYLAQTEGRACESAGKLLARILTERREKWTGRGKYKEPATPDTAALPPLPEGWTWASVEQLSTRIQYGSSAKTNQDSSGIPVLRMGNIQDGKFDFDSLKYLPKAHDEFPELLLARGDLLFNRTNSAELVGKTAVYKGTPHPCSFASYLIRARFGDGCVPDFVSYFINSVFGRAWIADVVSQQVGQANVNGTKLQAVAIPLPPLAEQERIVAEVELQLSVIEEQEAAVSANLQRATRLRQSVLQRAFSP
jgi:type I restriction enzyme S subunit